MTGIVKPQAMSISEDPEYSKIQIFWGPTPGPAGGAYSTPPDPLAGGEGG